MILFLSLILLAYVLLLAWLGYGFTKVNRFEYTGLKPKTAFSIIVPFRNESENLPVLLESISKLNYPLDLFEVILVDDFSDEAFEIPAVAFSLSMIENQRQSNSPKKDAILSAIKLAKSAWLITTDADCLLPENWLLSLDNFIQLHRVSMVAAAVRYIHNDTFLQQFQQLDLCSLQAATIGSFGVGKAFMCNGANFAYTKSFFEQLDGFQGNDAIASGDDVFLLQKAALRYPDKLAYLKSKNCIVSTKALDDWTSLFYQRVRWASKTASYQSVFGKGLGILVFMTNFGFVFALLAAVMGGLSYLFVSYYFVIKMLIDTVLIRQTARFLSKEKLRYLFLSSLFYPFFNSLVALYSLFGKYHWKGRRF